MLILITPSVTGMNNAKAKKNKQTNKKNQQNRVSAAITIKLKQKMKSNFSRCLLLEYPSFFVNAWVTFLLKWLWMLYLKICSD
jgi:aspartyl/asparaginyl beta-hydroxylase (cupin superfamily)